MSVQVVLGLCSLQMSETDCMTVQTVWGFVVQKCQRLVCMTVQVTNAGVTIKNMY